MLFNGLCVSAVCRPVTRKLANRGKRKIAYHPREAAVRRSSKLNGIGIAAAVAAVKMGADIEGAGVMASREDTSENLWARLYELAPIRSAKPASTLYDVIVDTADLETVKRYVAGGHELAQQFAGGHSVALAIEHGDLAFVRYFVENSTELDTVPDLLAAGVKRLSESTGANEQHTVCVTDVNLLLDL